MPIFYANSFDVCSSEEAFYVIFKCVAGEVQETLVVAISPSGAKVLGQALTERVSEHEEKVGGVKMWEKEDLENPNCRNIV